MVAKRNDALDDDLRSLGARERPLGDGYVRVDGLAFPTLLIELGEVAARDHDDYIALFAPDVPVPVEAGAWWYAHYGIRTDDDMDPKRMEEIKDMQRRFIESLPIEERIEGLDPEQLLASLDPRQRVSGLAPEQRLAGLSDADAVLAMPDGVLAGLTDAFVDALPAEVRDRVRARRAARR